MMSSWSPACSTWRPCIKKKKKMCFCDLNPKCKQNQGGVGMLERLSRSQEACASNHQYDRGSTTFPEPWFPHMSSEDIRLDHI
jgi:hypothetical protein